MRFLLVGLVLAWGSMALAAEEVAEAAEQQTSAEELLHSGLAVAKAANKPVFLIFGSPGCGWCKVFDKYHHDPDVQKLLDKHLVFVHVDIVDTPDGDELYQNHGSQRGVPAFSILDPEGAALADSGDGDQNIGFPFKPEEIDRYFQALEKAGLKLNDEEVVLLKTKLAEVRPQPRKAATTESAASPEEEEDSRPKIYDESADGGKQIAEALASAKQANKRVLLQFGANWCGWCHLLHQTFEKNDHVRKMLEADYVVVMIDAHGEHNSDVEKKYGNPTQHGLPVIVVLDADGKQLTIKDTVELEEGDHHDPQKVLEFLAEWAVPESTGGEAANTERKSAD